MSVKVKGRILWMSLLALVLLGVVVVTLERRHDVASPSQAAGHADRGSETHETETHPPSLRGHDAGGPPGDASTRARLQRAHGDLLSLARRMAGDWDRNLSLIEGTRQLRRPPIEAVIAHDDDLFRAWLALDLEFQHPAIGPRDLEALRELKTMFDGLRQEAEAGSALASLLDEMDARLRNRGALALPVELSDELLPRVFEGLRVALDQDAAEADLPAWAAFAERFHAWAEPYHEGPGSPFRRLAELDRRAGLRLEGRSVS